jgi:hypothetical protein
MSATLDTHPDPDVAALQSVDALARTLLIELRPALLRAEQRQRMRERKREAKAAPKQTVAPADDEDDAA